MDIHTHPHVLEQLRLHALHFIHDLLTLVNPDGVIDCIARAPPGPAEQMDVDGMVVEEGVDTGVDGLHAEAINEIVSANQSDGAEDDTDAESVIEQLDDMVNGVVQAAELPFEDFDEEVDDNGDHANVAAPVIIESGMPPPAVPPDRSRLIQHKKKPFTASPLLVAMATYCQDERVSRRAYSALLEVMSLITKLEEIKHLP